jgi:hypothetical protein
MGRGTLYHSAPNGETLLLKLHFRWFKVYMGEDPLASSQGGEEEFIKSLLEPLWMFWWSYCIGCLRVVAVLLRGVGCWKCTNAWLWHWGGNGLGGQIVVSKECKLQRTQYETLGELFHTPSTTSCFKTFLPASVNHSDVSLPNKCKQ